MNTKISFSGEVLEEVESFVYLGSIFTCDGNCTEDIRKRLAMGRSTMQSLSSVWKSKDISTTTKVTLLKALVGSNLWEWILGKLKVDRTSGSCEIMILRSCDTEIRKSGEGNRSRMCTRLQKSWSTTPTLDRWHSWMDWDEDQWSAYSSERSWSLERNTILHAANPSYRGRQWTTTIGCQ